MRILIVYYSSKQGNTRRLLQAVSEKQATSDQKDELVLLDVMSPEAAEADLNGYDMIGFASGIYFGSFHKSLLAFIQSRLPEFKKVFLIYTFASHYFSLFYCKRILNVLFEKHSVILGRYCCLGRSMVGIFRLCGGIARKHPNEQDINGALAFMAGLKKLFSPTDS